MEIIGKLKVKSDTKQVSEKFKSREFVITDNSSQYPQHISLQLTQDKCGLVDLYKIGDELKVHINLRGREWTSPQGEVKHFNTIEAWKIEKLGEGKATTTSSTNTSTAKTTTTTSEAFVASSSDDDLPF